LRMVDRFANGLYAIMARRACFGHARVVKPRDRPFSCRVATFAFTLSNHMITWFAYCVDIIVTAGASLRCADKYAAFMARIAGNFGVRASEREAGREVVEFIFGKNRRRKANGKARRHKN
jgi:hypothetical protein